MRIGGLQKSSLIDYPGKISAIIFVQGCTFRCPYCHNPELVCPELFENPIPEKDILEFLESRKNKLDAVVLSGGEPTIYPELPEFIRTIREMGFLIKLDSNGSNPDLLSKIINEKLVDYIAMDLKSPLEKYKDITFYDDIDKIKKSIDLIMNSGIPYEFRTTVIKSLLSIEDILKIGEMIKGARLYALQKFRKSKAVDESFLNSETYSDEEFEKIKEELEKLVKKCVVR